MRPFCGGNGSRIFRRGAQAGLIEEESGAIVGALKALWRGLFGSARVPVLYL